MEIDGEYGKLSPLNQITVLEILVRKCAGDEANMTCALQHMKFLLRTSLIGPRDLGTRSLEGAKAGSTSLVLLWLVKRDLTHAFIKKIEVSTKAKPDSLKALKDLCNHDTWLKMCGLGTCKPEDVSWQGRLTQAYRLCLDFLKIVFLDFHEGHVKSAMKSTRQGNQILENYKPFSELMQEIEEHYLEESGLPAKALEESLAANRSVIDQSQEESLKAIFAEDFELCDSEDTAAQLEQWTQAAAKKVDQFCKLLVDDPDYNQIAAALQGSVAGNADLEKVMLWIDLSKLGEASSMPHIRVPPFRAEVFKKFVKSFVAGRAYTGAP